MKYIKQLDSIRAIAVLLVMISHWIPTTYLINKIPNGGLGVDMFFVLSGFLITWILLDNRQKADLENAGKGMIIKNFYIRRTLRIFPIYYLVVFLLLIFSSYTGTDIKTSYPYYLTYTSNFYIHDNGEWPGILSHLWSLAVEEQFYLIWPALMLFVNKRYLLHVIYIFIGVGVLSQFLFITDPMGPIITTACFHAFGAGALLAWHLVYNKEGLPKLYKATKVLAAIAFVFFVAVVVKPEWNIIKVFRVISTAFGLFIITYLIYTLPTGKLKFGFIWNNRVLIFLGKISYGLYLYHNIIPYFTNKVMEKMGISLHNLLPYKLGSLLTIGINLSILMVVSWFSWILIEKPVLGLKKYFEYSGHEKHPQPGIEPLKVLQTPGTTNSVKLNK